MEKNSKKVIGFVSMDNPFLDKVAWSGTLYKLRESIEMAGFEVKGYLTIPISKVNYCIISSIISQKIGIVISPNINGYQVIIFALL